MVSDEISSDHDQLVSADTERLSADEVNDALEVAFGELRLLQAKIEEVKASEHKLRVENLALRTRLESLRSKRSFEMKFHVAMGISLWLVVMLAIGTAAIVFAL